MIVRKDAKYVLSLGIIVGVLGCRPDARVDSEQGDRDNCRLEFCDEKFTALVSSGLEQVAIKVPGHDQFYRVDGRTPGTAIKQLVFVPNRENFRYTAYTGRLDGRLIWSSQVNARLLLIHRVDHLERLSVSDAKAIGRSFEQ